MLPSLPQRQITDHSFLRCGLSSISLSLTAPSGTDEKNQNQKGSPTQDEGVKPVDTSKQRDEEDGTAGKSDSLSDQSQPPTETMVSLTTVCVVSAVAQTLHWSHTRVRLTFSLCLSHPLTWCVCLSIFPCQIHMACTHTHTKFPHTHTHLLAQTIFARGKQQKQEGWLSCYFRTYQCSSGLVICVWFMSQWMSEGPLSYRAVVSMCVPSYNNTAIVVRTTPLSSGKQQRSVCFVDTTVSQSF